MKYYKILRSDMIHHGFVYKEGLNIDTEPFDETPDCCGGLFFSDAQNVLSFCDYGDLIAEVEVPNGEKIIPVKDKYKSHAIVLKNIKPLWNIDTLEYLIQAGIDIHVGNDFAFEYAAGNGYLDIVKYLISQGANIHADNDLALRWASQKNQLEIVKYLISQDTEFEWGHLEVIQFLINNGTNIVAEK